MAETLVTINGQNSTATIMLTIPPAVVATAWECFFSSISMEANTEEIDSNVLCNEPNDVTEAGNTIFTFTFTGLLKKGRAAVAVLLANPRNVIAAIQYDTGCTFGATMNFNNTIATRIFNNNATLSTRARTKGAVTIAWA